MTSTNKLYVPDVSGLWAHSHDAETDLMKRFVVERSTPSGWLAVASYDDAYDAGFNSVPTFNERLDGIEYRVYDQSNGKVI